MNLYVNRLLRICSAATLLFCSGVALAEPADEYIVELYQIYCQACHAQQGTGAPTAFDASQWTQGTDQLVNNAIKGVGNMPALGGCMECAYQDFEDLINYMSQAEPK